jgi:hypothetical protein
VLTISRLSRWSINYHNDTARQAKQAAMDRQRANGGLGEYYSERDTRTPTWLLAGDTARTAELVALDGRAADGGSADPEMVQRWLDDGIAPGGKCGRAFTKGSVHGFDLTFAAPKSVSLLQALTDDVAEKVLQAAHLRAVDAAMSYLHQLPATPESTLRSPALRICSGCRGWWRSPTNTKPLGAVIRTCTPTSSCPTGKPAPTANWCRSIPSRCITRRKPPASSTKPPCTTS